MVENGDEMFNSFKLKQDGKPLRELKINNEIKRARILIYDIETAPNLAYVWGKYQQDVVDFHTEWYIMSIAWKWFGEDKTYALALNDFDSHEAGSTNDKQLVEKLHDLFNEADVIVAHNGNSFDIKKSNARFLMHNLDVPSFYKSIDTKLVAKKYFNFNSNKLNDLCSQFGLGEKVDTGGFELWLGCLANDKKAWAKMKKYNKHDVVLLEKLYLKFRPWIDNHPAVNVIESNPEGCPKCGSTNMQSRGLRYTKTMSYRRYYCNDCRGWCSLRTAEKRVTPIRFVN